MRASNELLAVLDQVGERRPRGVRDDVLTGSESTGRRCSYPAVPAGAGLAFGGVLRRRRWSIKVARLRSARSTTSPPRLPSLLSGPPAARTSRRKSTQPPPRPEATRMVASSMNDRLASTRPEV
jgi:hypothetical protein